MPGNFGGKTFVIEKLAKIHHEYNHYIAIEIFCDLQLCKIPPVYSISFLPLVSHQALFLLDAVSYSAHSYSAHVILTSGYVR